MLFFGKIQDKKLVTNSTDKFKEFINSLEGKQIQIDIKKKADTRSLQQNKALHKYFTLLAEALNDAGFDMRKTIKDGIDIPWNAGNIKEFLWRPVQQAYLQKESTTEITTRDIDKIFDIVNRTIGLRTGVYVPWPCEDEMGRQFEEKFNESVKL